MLQLLNFHKLVPLLLPFTSIVSAHFQSFSPPDQNGISYTVNVPQQTAASGSGPIFIQLKATVGVQWLAFGQGKQMKGSNIFVVYGSGNSITVSPRVGGAYVQPLYNSQAQISVLEGSGISNGTLTANIRCDSCITGGQEDVARDSSSSWVWAVKYGNLLESQSVSATIQQHDVAGLATLNLKDATGGNFENPFLTSFNTSTSTTLATVTTFSPQPINRKRIAHAVIMIVVMVILFPLFAMALHLLPSSRIVVLHGWAQVVTLALAAAGGGIGISLARDLTLASSYHAIIGMVVISSLILSQPVMGLLQHRYFRRTGKKSVFAYLHRWHGRVMLTMGIINVGLGLKLTGIGTSMAPVWAVITCSVVSGVVWLGYALIVFLILQKQKRVRHG